MKATIYHNPRCSKSRQTLAILEGQEVKLDIIEYLKTPPNQQELQDILNKLGISPIELMRKGESVFKELQLSDKSDDENALIDAMENNTIMIERNCNVM